MDEAGVDEVVEPFPGWPASVWVFRLRPRAAVLTTPERLKAVSRGVDAALGVPDLVQEDAVSWFARRGDGAPQTGHAWQAWMPRFNGDMPRMHPLEEKKLATGEWMERIAPWTDPKPPLRAPRPVRWRWRLVAFVYLPRAIWLMVASPVEAVADSLSTRLHRQISRALACVPAARSDDTWHRILRRGPAKMWDKTKQRYPLLLSDRQVPWFMAFLHRLPVEEGYGWHPQQWWWSSHREYASPEPVMREGVPRVSPLRPDPRRPWGDDHFHPSLLDKEELARAWRVRCYGRARRKVEEGAAERVDVSPELLRSRRGTAILGPGDDLNKLT